MDQRERFRIALGCNDWEHLFTLSSHEGWLSMLSWSPDGSRIPQPARIPQPGYGCFHWTGIGPFSQVMVQPLSSCVSQCTPETSAWSPNGERVVTMDEAGEVFIWDPGTGQELLELSGHTAWVDSAIWSPDGRRIATSSDDNTSRIWDANTGEAVGSNTLAMAERHTPDGHQKAIECC
ncbi:MAG: WD40 repeat domain-containing protein [Caldilineales bacterium]